MKTRNTIQLIGYLGADPAIKTFKNGNKMIVFRLATHHRIPTKEKEAQYVSTWHRIVAWENKMIEEIAGSALKGSHVMIEGMLSYRSYTDDQGKIHHITEIKATSFYNLDR